MRTRRSRLAIIDQMGPAWISWWALLASSSTPRWTFSSDHFTSQRNSRRTPHSNSSITAVAPSAYEQPLHQHRRAAVLAVVFDGLG